MLCERAAMGQTPPLGFASDPDRGQRLVTYSPLARRLPATGGGEPLAYGTPQRLAAGEARTHAPEEDDSVC